MFERLRNRLTRFLLVPKARFHFVKWRWQRRRSRLKFYEAPTPGVGEKVVSYNMTAFDSDAAFGCGGRMDLVLYPLAALLRERPEAHILIIGPRTEDDIYLAKALGLSNTRGLDLLSYSPHIDLGDMHAAPYPDASFDAVVFGWVIAYSGDPAKAFSEAKRILRPNGLLAIGWEWVRPEDKQTNTDIRGNPVNEVSEIVELAGLPVVFMNDPGLSGNHHKSIVFKF